MPYIHRTLTRCYYVRMRDGHKLGLCREGRKISGIIIIILASRHVCTHFDVFSVDRSAQGIAQ